MDRQKVFFPSNIKFLRGRKKLSQEMLANQLNFTRSKLAAIENGATKSPPADDLIDISNYFKISIDSLLKVDLAKLGELKLRELEAGNDVYMTGSKIRVLAITVDKSNKENVEYVPVKVKAGYRAGYNDPEFIGALPKFSFPNLPKSSSFRMFPISGDSMHPIPDGSDIICKYIQNWSTIKPGTLCIVILRGEQDFVFKKVTMQPGGLLLESLNRNYEPYTVTISEVLELWEFYRYQTGEVPEQETDFQSLAKTVLAIQQDIQVIKGQIKK